MSLRNQGCDRTVRRPTVPSRAWPGTGQWYAELPALTAAKAALDRLALALLGDHVSLCVVDAVRDGGGEEKVGELTNAIGRSLG